MRTIATRPLLGEDGSAAQASRDAWGRTEHYLSIERRLGRERLVRVTTEAVALEQAIERGAIHARQPRGPRHVSRRARDEASHVLLLEGRQHLVLRHVIRFVE